MRHAFTLLFFFGLRKRISRITLFSLTQIHSISLFHLVTLDLVKLVWDVNFHTQRQIARINLDGADQKADLNFKQ